MSMLILLSVIASLIYLLMVVRRNEQFKEPRRFNSIGQKTLNIMYIQKSRGHFMPLMRKWTTQGSQNLDTTLDILTS